MTPEGGGARLLAAWHLRSVLSMPRMFWLLRQLEQDGRGQAECQWMHRWISRRSLLLTSHWVSAEAATGWMASPKFRAFDDAARAIEGTEAWTDLDAPQ